MLRWRIIKIGEMKALMWKAVLATLNPSPVFEAVATFAEEFVINGNDLAENKFAQEVRACHSNKP